MFVQAQAELLTTFRSYFSNITQEQRKAFAKSPLSKTTSCKMLASTKLGHGTPWGIRAQFDTNYQTTVLTRLSDLLRDFKLAGLYVNSPYSL